MVALLYLHIYFERRPRSTHKALWNEWAAKVYLSRPGARIRSHRDEYSLDRGCRKSHEYLRKDSDRPMRTPENAKGRVVLHGQWGVWLCLR